LEVKGKKEIYQHMTDVTDGAQNIAIDKGLNLKEIKVDQWGSAALLNHNKQRDQQESDYQPGII
jgi:hypothetical protein